MPLTGSSLSVVSLDFLMIMLLDLPHPGPKPCVAKLTSFVSRQRSGTRGYSYTILFMNNMI